MSERRYCVLILAHSATVVNFREIYRHATFHPYSDGGTIKLLEIQIHPELTC